MLLMREGWGEKYSILSIHRQIHQTNGNVLPRRLPTFYIFCTGVRLGPEVIDYHSRTWATLATDPICCSSKHVISSIHHRPFRCLQEETLNKRIVAYLFDLTLFLTRFFLEKIYIFHDWGSQERFDTGMFIYFI